MFPIANEIHVRLLWFRLPDGRLPDAWGLSRRGLQAPISFVKESRGTKRNLVTDAAQDEFLSVQECAKILKLSKRWIYNKLRAGEGPPHKRFGNRYRIYRAHFLKWAKPKGR